METGMRSRQIVIFGGTMLVAAAVAIAVVLSPRRGADIGFWFDPITTDTLTTVPERLSDGISVDDLSAIESIARREIAHAFREFHVRLSDSRQATYRVRVVDSLRNPMAPRAPSPSGESRSIPGLGGQGAVSFRVLAHSAIAFAPPDAGRVDMIGAIGRGIGRAAVHEFAHQVVGSAPIHDSTDVRSYEYRTAARPEQYYGEMHWDIARPLLEKRLGLQSSNGR